MVATNLFRRSRNIFFGSSTMPLQAAAEKQRTSFPPNCPEFDDVPEESDSSNSSLSLVNKLDEFACFLQSDDRSGHCSHDGSATEGYDDDDAFFWQISTQLVKSGSSRSCSMAIVEDLGQSQDISAEIYHSALATAGSEPQSPILSPGYNYPKSKQSLRQLSCSIDFLPEEDPVLVIKARDETRNRTHSSLTIEDELGDEEYQGEEIARDPSTASRHDCVPSLDDSIQWEDFTDIESRGVSDSEPNACDRSHVSIESGNGIIAPLSEYLFHATIAPYSVPISYKESMDSCYQPGDLRARVLPVDEGRTGLCHRSSRQKLEPQRVSCLRKAKYGTVRNKAAINRTCSSSEKHVSRCLRVDFEEYALVRSIPLVEDPSLRLKLWTTKEDMIEAIKLSFHEQDWSSRSEDCYLETDHFEAENMKNDLLVRDGNSARIPTSAFETCLSAVTSNDRQQQ
jgi:hypothetical protein